MCHIPRFYTVCTYTHTHTSTLHITYKTVTVVTWTRSCWTQQCRPKRSTLRGRREAARNMHAYCIVSIFVCTSLQSQSYYTETAVPNSCFSVFAHSTTQLCTRTHTKRYTITPRYSPQNHIAANREKHSTYAIRSESHKCQIEYLVYYTIRYIYIRYICRKHVFAWMICLSICECPDLCRNAVTHACIYK